MISPDIFKTYAQYNEDITLAALFDAENHGVYVDVGANHPVQHSVTKLFYDRGWNGINIEPNPRLHKLLEKERPRDKNLNMGTADKEGKLSLRLYHSRDGLEGLSTFSRSIQQMYSSASDKDNQNFTDIEVAVRPLADTLDKIALPKINFIKIDVEGFEYEVVKGNNWKKHRPEVVCIEANHRLQDWRPILIKHNYKLFINDGLNEYYVAEEAWHRTKGFADRATVLSGDKLNHQHYESWQRDINELKNATTRLTELDKVTTELRQNLNEAMAGTLVGQPLRVRLRRAGIGLTVDWWRFKQENKEKV